jgi:hypothetical protein
MAVVAKGEGDVIEGHIGIGPHPLEKLALHVRF